MFKLIFIFLLIIQYNNATRNEKIVILNDFINEQHSPKKMVAFFCNNKDSIDFLKSMRNSGNFASVSKVIGKKIPSNYPRPNEMIFILDTDCDLSNTNELFEQFENGHFASPYRWIILLSKYKRSFLENLIQNISILVDSDFTVISRKNPITFSVEKYYKYRINSQLIIESIGFWTETRGYIINDHIEHISAKRRSNLQEHVLYSCIVITHNSTYAHLLDRRLKHIDTIAKVNYVFMLHIGDMLNATMRYTFESSWGYKDNKSDWNGMIGQLTRKEADIGGTPLFLTSDRVAIIDYIAMTTSTKSKFVFRQPKLSYITNVFSLPFTMTVWISCLALVAVTALCLFAVVKWEWYKNRNNPDFSDLDHEIHDSFIDVTFMAVGAVCQQGASAIPSGLPGRMITILLFISLMFLYTSYSANIVALLQSASTSIQTLQDLLKSRLDVGVDDTVFNRFYFPNATEPIRMALYREKVAPPGQQPRYFPIEEGVRRIREGLFAFHMETGAGYKIVVETFLEDEKCGLQEIQFLQVPDPWLAIQKNSSFKEMLKISLRKLQESGLQLREVHLLYTHKPECTSRGSSFIGVGIVDCYPAAVILVGGLLSALFVLVLECYIHHRFKKRGNKIKYFLYGKTRKNNK